MAAARAHRFWRDNSLTLVLLAVFALTLGGQLATGWIAENEALARHGAAPLPLGAYLVGGAFLSSVFENWESEFLQMAAYVILTAMLYQRGSAESRDPDADPSEEEDGGGPGAPWPARGGPIMRRLYESSLGLALVVLFVASFACHWTASLRAAAAEARLHGAAPPDAVAYLLDAGFWFESFQNWQSEFLSTAVLVVLSIFLRQKGSPESKPVAAPTWRTGA